MNHRLTATAAIATFLASLSLSLDLRGGGWFTAALGAVLAVAIAGTLTRLASVPAAIAATLLALLAVTPLWGLGLWETLGAVSVVAVVALSATGVRPLRLLAAACTYLAALLLFLNLAFAGAQSLARTLPSTASMHHLSSLVNSGEYQFRYEPPLPLTPGLIFLTAAAIGLVAIVVDVLAVRLRRPAIAGLPLLVLFCVPIASNIKHVGTEQVITFILGITGFLVLLAADSRDRLRTWGKPVTLWTHAADEQEQRPNTKGMAASGRRIGLAALGVATVVPLLLPGLTAHDLFAGQKPSLGVGGQNGRTALPSSVHQLRSDLRLGSPQTVLSYTTTSEHTREQYLQLYVFNYNPAPNTWTLVRDKDTVPAGRDMAGVPGLTPQVSRIRTSTTVTMANVSAPAGEKSFLALPYPPTSLSVSAGNWREGTSTLMVSGNDSPAELTYTVHSDYLDPTPGELDSSAKPPSDIEHSYAGYTGPYRDQLLRIAEQHTKGSVTELQKATALEDWFTGGAFTYSVRTGLQVGQPDWLVKFLTTGKRGFCVQFAYAFATLARLLGIPARVAEGFTAGTPAGHGVWNVTTADVHMWPEVYFPGASWLRFEPTPSGQGAGQGTATTPRYASGPTRPACRHCVNPPQIGSHRHHGKTGSSRFKNKNHPSGRGGAPATGALAVPKPTDLLPWLIAALAIVTMLLLTPITCRMLTRRRRWHEATDDVGLARAAWLELTDDLTDHGVAGPRSESPRGLARRVTKTEGLDPAVRRAVSRIAAAQERAIYAPAPAAGSGLAADVRIVRRGIAVSAPRPWRWRARLMPASTIHAVIDIAHNVANALTWVDRAVVWLGSKTGQLLRKPPSVRPLV